MLNLLLIPRNIWPRTVDRPLQIVFMSKVIRDFSVGVRSTLPRGEAVGLKRGLQAVKPSRHGHDDRSGRMISTSSVVITKDTTVWICRLLNLQTWNVHQSWP